MNSRVAKTATLSSLISFLLILPLFSQSPKLQFQAVQIEHGISDLRVTSIIQDPKGFMWFGTWDGLQRYDGYNYQVYRHNPMDSTSLPGNYIEELFVDSRGNIWVALIQGEVGLCRYDPLTDGFIPYRHIPDDATTIGSTGIQSITETKDGYLWFGSGAGLDRLDPETGIFKHFHHIPHDSTTITPGQIFSLYEDRRGDLWVGTGATWVASEIGGLNLYHPETESFTRFQQDPDDPFALQAHAVMTTLEDKNGNFWIGTSGDGLYQMNREKRIFIHFPYNSQDEQQLSGPRLFSMPSVNILHEDGLGRLWIGGYGGMGVYDPKTTEIQRFQGGDINFWEIGEDPSGNIWLGAGTTGGLFKVSLQPPLFEEFRDDPREIAQVFTQKIYSLSNAGKNQLWAVTEKNLSLVDLESGSVNLQIPAPDIFYVLYQENLNTLWLGGVDGLYRMDISTQRFKHFPIYTENPRDKLGTVLKILKGPAGTLWIGTLNQGLLQFNIDSAQFTPWSDERFSIGRVGSLLNDGQGQLWMGAENGLFRLHPAQNQSDKLFSAAITSLFLDSRENLWMGTDREGLWLYDNSARSVSKFTIRDGLPSNSVFEIAEDPHGKLWLKTGKKISKLDPESMSFQNFDLQDGVFNEFHSYFGSSIASDTSGNIYFGGNKGITKINTRESAFPKSPPQVYIHRIQTDTGNISLPDHHRSSLEFSYHQNTLVFEFVALHFANPSKNQYQYYLEHLDRDWSMPTTDRKARYPKLSPGRYTFRVKAASSEGVWSEEEATVDIIIHPPWWATTWAYAGYILLGLGLLYLIRRFELQKQERKLELERQKLAQERQINEQLRHVDQLKDQFLANTSHELRTPLHGIIGLSESLKDGVAGELPVQAVENLDMITASGKRLASLVNDILDFSRLKTHDIQLQLRPVDLRAATAVVLKMSEPLIKGKDIRLRNQISDDLPPALADENRLQQILHNLVGNAIKFTNRGTVEVSAKKQGDLLKLAVVDTGIGIPKEKLPHIFESFEQADASTQRAYGGTGLGLAITRQLVELHSGKMEVASQIDQGSQFYFTLPMAKGEKATPSAETLVPLRTYSPLSPAAATSGSFLSRQTPEVFSDRAQFNILVVDDDPVNQRVLRNYLSDDGYMLTQAMNGGEALAAIESDTTFDAVLLDIMMPGMSGYEVCQKIREQYLPSELPILMVTAKNQVTDLVEAFKMKANDYLVKPISKKELLARLKTHLNLLHINQSYSRFVPREFFKALGRDNILDVRLGDQVEEEVTVLFSDIRSYTALSESMSVEHNFKFLNAYLKRVVPIINANQGLVQQFLGDGIMALFLNQPEDAIRASIAYQRMIRQYNDKRLRSGQQPLSVGIGLHSGPLMLGIIGNEKRMGVGVVSDTVNTASRMEGLTKHFGVSIIVSEESLKRLDNPEAFHYRYLGNVQVKGKKSAIRVYEFFDGDPEALLTVKIKTASDFAQGLRHYYDKQFEEAAVVFKRVLQLNPHDTSAEYYLKKAARLIVQGPGDEWTGLEVMMEK